MTPLRPVSAAPPGSPRPRPAGSGFTLPSGPTGQAAGMAAVGSLGGAGFLALQEAPEPPDRRARRRAGTLLAELRSLQLELLGGRADPGQAARLQALAQGEAAGDPVLQALVDEVALRARVEAARHNFVTRS